MAIRSISLNATIEGISNISLDNYPTSLLDQVDKLVKSFESNPYQDIAPTALGLIEELYALDNKSNLALVREGLSRLLPCSSEEVQFKIVQYLQPLFSLSHLDYDIQMNQLQQFVALEEHVSTAINACLRLGNFYHLMIPLLELYLSILERLWLLAHLKPDQEGYMVLEQHRNSIRDHTKGWSELIQQTKVDDQEKIIPLLRSIEKNLQWLESPSLPAFVGDELTQLAAHLEEPYISYHLGNIDQKMGDLRRAEWHLTKSLESINSSLQSSEIGKNTRQELIVIACSIGLNLGNVYLSLGKYDLAIQHLEKALAIMEINPKEAEIYSCLGKTFYYKRDSKQSLIYYQRAIRAATESNDVNLVGKTLVNIGVVYQFLLSNSDEAIKYYNEALDIAIRTNDHALEGKVYVNLGTIYHFQRNWKKEIEFNCKALPLIQEQHDQNVEGKIYNGLGLAHRALGELDQAMSYFQNALKIAQATDDVRFEGDTHSNLGIVSYDLGQLNEAIKHYKESLKIAERLNNVLGQATAHRSLGIVYQFQGNYVQAVQHQKKALKLAPGDKRSEAEACIGLGNAYHFLGEYSRAIEWHDRVLKLAIELSDPLLQETAYTNLGNAYHSLEDYSKAIELYHRALTIAESLNKLSNKGRAYGALGNAYFCQGDLEESYKMHTQALQIGQQLNEPAFIARCYADLGVVYGVMEDKCKDAITMFDQALKLLEKLSDREGQGRVYCDRGLVEQKLGNIEKAEENLRKSIEFFSSLQEELKEHHQWKITLFEAQAEAYINLESLLLMQQRINDAAEIADSRRSRALVSSLSKKFASEVSPLISSPMTSLEMQILAQKLKSTFVIYSLSPLQADHGKIGAWIIPPQGHIIWQPLPSDALLEEIKDPSKILKNFPYAKVRPQRGKSLDADFNERLSRWYKTFISPIEPYLPKDPRQTLTLVPDGFLSHLPFAAFQDKEGKYLIEKHPISIAPSIKVLQLLDQIPKTFFETSLLVGNPITPDPQANNLQLTEKEVVNIIAPLLKTPSNQVLVQHHSTVTRFIEEITHARWIHLACHGLPEEKLDPHSVFEGLFKLAADREHLNGYLYAQEIAFLSLRTELVFMSACHSGRGKIQREGSIGPIWSFLAAGALSTVATYWPLPETELTLQMVETFYRHLLGIGVEKLNKAQALQRAMLMAMEKERDKPRQWGAFFLSGLST
jgi:tetratricopeptide (TPR) repeat protein